MSEKDTMIEELTAQVYQLTNLNNQQGNKIEQLSTDIQLLNGKLNELTAEARSFQNRLIDEVIEQGTENNYCTEGQISFVAQVLNISEESAEKFFVETHTMSVTFTTHRNEDLNISNYDIAEFLQTYIDHGGAVDVKSVEIY